MGSFLLLPQHSHLCVFIFNFSFLLRKDIESCIRAGHPEARGRKRQPWKPPLVLCISGPVVCTRVGQGQVEERLLQPEGPQEAIGSRCRPTGRGSLAVVWKSRWWEEVETYQLGTPCLYPRPRKRGSKQGGEVNAGWRSQIGGCGRASQQIFMRIRYEKWEP